LSISAPRLMLPDDWAVLLRRIADAFDRHANGDPDMLARRRVKPDVAQYQD
jgi:hypothetical protein